MTFRIEEKLAVNSQNLFKLYEWIKRHGGRTLYPDRTINSVYYDNSSLQMFQDSEEGCVPRKKIRVRYYGQKNYIDQDLNFEVKVSSVEGRFKTQKIINNIPDFFLDKQYGIVKPKSMVSYSRSYYEIFNQRLTIDKAITYNNYKNAFFKKEFDIAVEIKSKFNTDSDFLLEHFPFNRKRFSKYCRSIILLNLN